MSLLSPKKFELILDVGVADSDGKDNFTNFFEVFYPLKSNITAVGLTEGENFKKGFPEVKYIKSDGRKLPFEENQFDIAFSNAVLEHVGGGDYNEQKKFVSEIIRVSKRGMRITPYKYCLIEPHILILFFSYFPKRVRNKIIKRSLNWNLLTTKEFINLFPDDIELKIIKQKVLLFLPTNLIAIYRKINK